MVPRETENNAYAKFWGDKKRVLWYFLEWSITPLGITPSWNRLNTSRAPHDKRALVPVVQTLDSAIHRINLYPVGNTYRLDSDLSGG